MVSTWVPMSSLRIPESCRGYGWSWRNWIARKTSNLEVPGSSPGWSAVFLPMREYSRLSPEQRYAPRRALPPLYDGSPRRLVVSLFRRKSSPCFTSCRALPPLYDGSPRRIAVPAKVVSVFYIMPTRGRERHQMGRNHVQTFFYYFLCKYRYRYKYYIYCSGTCLHRQHCGTYMLLQYILFCLISTAVIIDRKYGRTYGVLKFYNRRCCCHHPNVTPKHPGVWIKRVKCMKCMKLI